MTIFSISIAGTSRGWCSTKDAPTIPAPVAGSAHPQQMHLDIRVGDLDAADSLVMDRGATRLADFDDHRVYADIIGHPFCLYPADVSEPLLWRLVIDGADPDALQEFYERLLGNDTTPALAFQHSNAAPPRWPDPAYPAQVHVDLVFDDPAQIAGRSSSSAARCCGAATGSRLRRPSRSSVLSRPPRRVTLSG